MGKIHNDYISMEMVRAEVFQELNELCTSDAVIIMALVEEKAFQRCKDLDDAEWVISKILWEDFQLEL
jgi:hypothetical protein